MAVPRSSRIAPPEQAAADSFALRIERAAVTLAVLLLVARPTFPSEDASQGTGLVVVTLWGIAAMIWAAAQVKRRELCLFAGPADLWALILLVAILASTAWAESLRPAINMASEWAGLLLCYFLIRQLFRAPGLIRLLAVAMLALAFALAAYGIYQAFWGLDILRGEYYRDRIGALRALGIQPGSPEQLTFENRLRSHEPFSTFALANSLAGFLVAWIPLGVAWLFETAIGRQLTSGHRSGGVQRGTLYGFYSSRKLAVFIATLAIGTMILCLALTQSRTAYAAAAVALAGTASLYVTPLLRKVSWDRSRVRVAAMATVIGLLGIILVLAAAARRGKIDLKLLTEAGKSFSFRWQYWQATGGLIRDRFWTGTGLGNFRGHYLRYMLPKSSEEIADPHNLLLEVWATSGVVAAAALVAILLTCVRLTRCQTALRDSHQSIDWGSLLLAGLGGFSLAWFLSGMDPPLYAWLFLAWLVAAIAVAIAFHARPLQAAVFAWAVIGMAVHLLGAGGIGMPGVAQSFWVLLALGLNVSEGERRPWRSSGVMPAATLCLATGVAVVCFGIWVLRPMTASKAALSQGRMHLQRQERVVAEGHFQEAARRDPLSAEPWIELYRIHYRAWKEGGMKAEQEFQDAVVALEQAIEREPRRFGLYTLLGALFSEQAVRRPHYWLPAIEAYRRSVAIYPSNARLHFLLGDALWNAGEWDDAYVELGRALELDERNPHPDKKLESRQRAAILQRLGQRGAGRGGAPRDHDD